MKIKDLRKVGSKFGGKWGPKEERDAFFLVASLHWDALLDIAEALDFDGAYSEQLKKLETIKLGSIIDEK